MKVITGIRHCGKSFLLGTLYRNYLLEQGVPAEQILFIELDLTKDHDPLALAEYVRSTVVGKNEQFYLLVGEI